MAAPELAAGDCALHCVDATSVSATAVQPALQSRAQMPTFVEELDCIGALSDCLRRAGGLAELKSARYSLVKFTVYCESSHMIFSTPPLSAFSMAIAN